MTWYVPTCLYQSFGKGQFSSDDSQIAVDPFAGLTGISLGNILGQSINSY